MTSAIGRGAMWAGFAVMAALAARHAGMASHQAVWQADVRVQLMEVTALRGRAPAEAQAAAPRQLSARIVITSDNDDEARGVRLDVLLPVGAGIVRLPRRCQAVISAVATPAGRVTCDLGVIPVRGLEEVVIATTGTVSPSGGRFAAFVSSDTPDPVPGNNFAERRAP
jgi:hypothetical protein